MFWVRSIILGLAVLALSLTAESGAAPKKPKKDEVPPGYSKVESVDQSAKTFKLVGDEIVYKFTDATVNKEKIEAGAVLKANLKEKTKDQVTSIDVPLTVPPKPKKKEK